jgi:hypothetical protein
MARFEASRVTDGMTLGSTALCHNLTYEIIINHANINFEIGMLNYHELCHTRLIDGPGPAFLFDNQHDQHLRQLHAGKRTPNP